MSVTSILSANDDVVCDFCGGHAREVEVVVQGPEAAICSGCVELARDLVGAYRLERRPADYGVNSDVGDCPTEGTDA